MNEGLRIYTLGGVRILKDGQRVGGFGTRKAEALLVYLASTRRPQPREALADLLWDERSQSQSLGNLRVVLTRLRQQLGEFVSVTRDVVELNPAMQIWLDEVELEECLQNVQKPGGIQSAGEATQVGKRILQLYQGEFLDGFSVSECRQFEDWVTRERERLHYLAVDRLKELVAYELEYGSYAPGLEHASKLLALDPLLEEAHRQMMLLLAYSGQRASALDQYEACLKILSTELQVEPSLETTQLFESIRDGTLETGRWFIPSPMKEPPAAGDCPYKGLQHFDEADAPLFFGREALVARLAARILPQIGVGMLSSTTQETWRFLAVIGASGSGKSSVVRAGLVPAIRRATNWPIQMITPTAHPLETLAGLPAPFSKLLDKGDEPGLLVVDQFEELFSLCREEAERKAFIDRLLALIDPGQQGMVTLVIALRADFYAACAPFENLRQALAQRQEYIGPMNPAELRLAIEEPARLGNWDLEKGLVRLFLRDIGVGSEGQATEPGALPLLSHALMETWLRRQGRMLTLAGYAEAGGVRGAVAKTAESVYAQLTLEEQSLARNIFLRLTELGEGTQETRRRASLAELIPAAELSIVSPGANVQRVLKTLADARLITTTAETAEVAHEALIREWGRLQDWLHEDREGLNLHRRLTEAAQEWAHLQRDAGTLYRGARLAQALEWSSANSSALNELEKEFLQASQAESERFAAELEAQRQRELEAAQRLAEAERQRAEEQRRAARRLRRRAISLSLSLAAVFILALAAILFARQANQNLHAAQAASTQANAQKAVAQAASTQALAQRSTAEAARLQAISEANTRATAEAVAVQEKENAQQQNRLATARELASASLINQEVDQERSVLLAMQAVKTADIPEAENALHQAVLALRLRDSLEGNSEPVNGVAFAPESSSNALRFAVGTDDGTIKIWELDKTSLKVNQSPLLTISNPLDFKVWAEATSYAVAFSPDGKLLAAISSDQTAKIWDASSGKLLHKLSGHTGNVLGLTFSPDGELLATGSADGTVKIWNAQTGEELQTLTGHTGQVGVAVFSPDGKRLASLDTFAGVAILWDRVEERLGPTPKPQFTRSFSIQHPFQFVITAAFSPDGNQLAMGYKDIYVYDLTSASTATPARLVLNMTAHEIVMTGLYYSPDGSRLVSGSGDGTAKVWDADTGKALFILSGDAGWITSIALSSNGDSLLTASQGGQVKVWDLSPKGNQEWLNLPDLNIGFFSLQGNRLLAYDDNPDKPQIQVLEISSAGAREELHVDLEPGHPDTFYNSNFFAADQDLSRLVTIYPDDLFIHVWDLKTGQEQKTFTIEKTGTQPGHAQQDITALRLSPDGDRLVTTGSDGIGIVWDVQTGKPLYRLGDPTNTFNSWDPVNFSPDGNLLASANYDGSLRIWDARSGALLHDLPGHQDALPLVSFSSDSKRLFATGEGTTLNLWDVQTGQLLLTLPASSTTVNTIGISPDNRYLAAARLDGTIQVWDANTGQELLTLPGIYMRFTADSKHLIGLTGEGAFGYFLDINDLVALARTRLTRSWTPEECSRFLHMETCPSAP